MKKQIMALLLTATLWGGGSDVFYAAHAEDLKALLEKTNKLVEEKNYPGAINELNWAQKEIEKLHQQRLVEILPKDVQGFTGNDPEIQTALGFTTLEREYQKGEQSITMSISGGAGGDGLGGLAGLAKMGMMMGGTQQGVDKIRIGALTASLDTTGTPELTVFLDSGSILQLRSSEGVDSDTLKKFAEGLKLTELDSYLKGAKA